MCHDKIRRRVTAAEHYDKHSVDEADGEEVEVKIVPYAVFWMFYIAALLSLVLPIRAIEDDRPLWNHIFLLIWAVAAMAFAVFRSRQETRCSSKIVGDVIVTGVVVYSGLALFLVVFGDLYREILETTFRVSNWNLIVFALESLLLALGSIVVIGRTNGWSRDESHFEGDAEE